MISFSHAKSKRDRLLSPALSGCAERFTLPPLAYLGGVTIKKDCYSLAAYAGKGLLRAPEIAAGVNTT